MVRYSYHERRERVAAARARKGTLVPRWPYERLRTGGRRRERCKAAPLGAVEQGADRLAGVNAADRLGEQRGGGKDHELVSGKFGIEPKGRNGVGDDNLVQFRAG